MRLIGKLLALPFVLVMGILYLVCKFLVVISGAVLGILSGIVFLAALVLFTFPGSPMIYYGDEAGMEGFEDPLNRGTYPWGREDRDLLAWFTRLGALRNAYPALQSGTISWLYTAGPLLIFARQDGDQRLTTAVNASPDSHTVTLLWEGAGPTDLLTGDTLPCSGGVLHLQLPPWGCRLLL